MHEVSRVGAVPSAVQQVNASGVPTAKRRFSLIREVTKCPFSLVWGVVFTTSKVIFDPLDSAN